ncbi:MAG TPA: YceI family protein [Panacibacter sp.]|nr:YceI family protein [Panacibacter sp.]
MKTLSVVILILAAFNVNAQDYLTRNGNISIYSHTDLEDVKGNNNEVVSLLNSATGSFDFKVAIKSFHFAKAAMEDHFNDENYMETDKYPKAGFSGKITNMADINFSKDGVYTVTVSGNLSVKDVTKPVTAKGTITVKNGKVSIQSTFTVKRKDYHVMGQSFVQSKLSDDIQITVNCDYDKR